MVGRQSGWPIRGLGGITRCVAVAALLLLTLSGCSTFKFFYSFAGNLIENHARFHLDMDAKDKKHLSAQVDALIAWHRATMLPRYAEFLLAQAAIVEKGPPDRKAVATAAGEMRRLLDDTITGGAPFTAAVLVRHTTPDRVEYLRERMAERLIEKLDQLKDLREDRLQRRIGDIADNYERFTGPLNDGQMAIIRLHAEATLDHTETWLRNRAKRHQAVGDFMASQPDERSIAAYVPRIVLRSHEIVDPAYEAVSEARWAYFEDLLFNILSSLTDKQRKRFVVTLRAYASDMVELAAS